MESFHDYGINWIWYLDATIGPDNTITIHRHYRIHKGETGHPRTKKSFRIIEGENRTAEQVDIEPNRYRVTNPKYVFDYK